MSLRSLFVSAANAFIAAGENDRAEEMLDKCQTVLDSKKYPYDNSILGWGSNALYPIDMVRDYYILGKPDKAKALAGELTGELMESIRFYLDFYPMCKSDFEYNCNLVYYMTNEIRKAGDKEFADEIEKKLGDFLSAN